MRSTILLRAEHDVSLTTRTIHIEIEGVGQIKGDAIVYPLLSVGRPDARAPLVFWLMLCVWCALRSLKVLADRLLLGEQLLNLVAAILLQETEQFATVVLGRGHLQQIVVVFLAQQVDE